MTFYNIIKFDEIASTNDYMVSHLSSLPHKTCVIANKQSAGRGMGTNLWFSRDYIDLTCSILYHIPYTMNLQIAPLFFSLAVLQTYSYFNIQVKTKWFNDIYCHQQFTGSLTTDFEDLLSFKQFGDYLKISGLLVNIKNLDGNQYMVVGVGMNNMMGVDTAQILQQLLLACDHSYCQLLQYQKPYPHHLVIKQYLRHCLHYRQTVKIKNYQDQQCYIGQHFNISNNGAIILKIANQKLIEIAHGQILAIDL